MKDQVFIVRIGDLLQQAGKTDTMKFAHKFTDQLPNLGKNGISGTLAFQWLNTESIYTTLEDVRCTLHETCDSCESLFERTVEIPQYTARFVINEEIKNLEQNQTDEEIFLINPKDESIDIEDMVVQAIRLQDPFVVRCSACQKKFNSLTDEDEDVEYLEGKENVVFH
jgi:uncharacterized metal-binding protein YceD (DUF177 family)